MTPTFRRVAAAVAAPAALLFALSACGGGGRPSVDELEEALTSGEVSELMGSSELPEEAVTCMAEVLHESDLSDEALQALVEGDTDFEGEDGDEEALSGVTSDMAECGTASME